MGLGAATDVAALVAHRTLTSTDDAMSRALERLASGSRINRAADDAAGLVIPRNLSSQPAYPGAMENPVERAISAQSASVENAMAPASRNSDTAMAAARGPRAVLSLLN